VAGDPRSRKNGETWGTLTCGTLTSGTLTPGTLAPNTLASGTPMLPQRFWQARFYDFNVWTERKLIEKLNYIHRNPVERGLVASPEQWRWSSFRWYLRGEPGPVQINDTDILVMTVRPPAA